MTPAELRGFGHRMLGAVYPEPGARDKTLTVMFHLWINVPKQAVPLRNAAQGLLLSHFGNAQLLALHWGMAVATYPFFRDLGEAAGRLLAQKGTVSLAELQRPVAERWGCTPTVTRAAQRIVQSWVDWGVLRETESRGVYSGPKRVALSEDFAAWLVEAVLTGREPDSRVLNVRSSELLFPFDFRGARRSEAHGDAPAAIDLGGDASERALPQAR